jgi:hypothetical protein
MFQSIKAALSKDESSSGAVYKEIMRLETGKTYTVRLLPNTTVPEKTFFHFFTHGWTSFATGQYVQALSLQTFEERDPIAEERYKLIRLGNEVEKSKAETIIRSEKWLVNAYVIDDPTTPSNNGQVKILRYGRQLQKIIDQAINGEDADEYGMRVFDLSKNGVNLKIKVEKQGEYPTYVSSRFTSPADLNLSEAAANAIYGKTHDIEKAVTAKSYNELVEMLNEHFHCKTAGSSRPNHVQEEPVVSKVVQETVSEPVRDTAPINTVDELDDETVRELLKGLE